MRRLIIGTAGHIDHGKTALVKALTGVDADRLKEEKERGITIDIGFADLTVDDTHFAIIDVPGHERFVRNMLAGVHGIDIVMLIVAGDEGVMPQTREHFDICRLLEVKAGLVVITKADLAEPDLLQVAQAEIRELTRNSFLEGAPIVHASSRTGAGIDLVKQALVSLAERAAPRDEDAIVRLPIDRVFTVRGFGTVATGTVIAGKLHLEDEVEIFPDALQRIKIRGIQTFGRSVAAAGAGERAAINLQGVAVEDLHRGQVLAGPDTLQASSMLDVRLHLLPSAPRILRSRSRVRLHIGTAEVLGRAVVIGKPELQPGENGLVQLRLETPVTTVARDHFIIRFASPAVTIGGGHVVDPLPEKYRLKFAVESLSRLQALDSQSELERIRTLVEWSGVGGIIERDVVIRSGGGTARVKSAVDTLVEGGNAICVSQDPRRLLSGKTFSGLVEQMILLVAVYHQKNPGRAGMSREELRESGFSLCGHDVFRMALAKAVASGRLAVDQDNVRLANVEAMVAPRESAFKTQLGEASRSAGLEPVLLQDLLTALSTEHGLDLKRARSIAQSLASNGQLIVVGEFAFHRETIEALKASLRDFKSRSGAVLDVATFKDLAGVSRKYAIPLLEYLDRQGFTRRTGASREIL